MSHNINETIKMYNTRLENLKEDKRRAVMSVENGGMKIRIREIENRDGHTAMGNIRYNIYKK